MRRGLPPVALLRAAARRAVIPTASDAFPSSAARCLSLRPAAGLAPALHRLPSRAASSSSSSSNRAVAAAVTPQSVPAETFDELKQFLMEPSTEGPAMQRAQQIVRLMMQRHVFPAMPGQEATVMVMVADAMEDRTFTREVYACLRDAGVSPSPLTLELTALACAELGDWETAGEVVEFMHQAIDLMHPSSDIYENAIAACYRADKWMRAKQFLDEMLSYRLEAAPEVHIQCLKLCIGAKELTATKALLQRFLATFEFEPEEVEDVLTELFDKAIAVSSSHHALFFRDQMHQRGFAFTKRACADLVQLCAVERKWHRARVLLAQFRGAAPPPAAKSSEYARDIQALLDDLASAGFDVGLPIYNAALRNYVQLMQDKDAMRVFDAMQQQRRVAPDAVSYAAAITTCRADVARADRLFQEMVNRDCAPSPNVYHAFLLTASLAGEWQLLIDRYSAIATVPSEKQMVDQDSRIQSLVAVAYGRLQQHQSMLQVFTSMKVRGLRPTLYVYGEAMYAYIRQANWRHALLLFDHIHKEDIDPHKLAGFSMIWDAAVLAAVEGGQVERAAALFSDIMDARASISPHTAVLLVETLENTAAPALWDAFKRMEDLHRVKNRSTPRHRTANDNPKVVNALLKRAVDARDVEFAEKLVADAENELEMVFNSMTYSLLLRLYAAKENHESFHYWSERMASANVKITLFTYRAVLQHLKALSGSECEKPAYFEAIFRLLDLSVDADAEDNTQRVIRIGGLILDRMERRGLTDALSLEYYLRLSPDPHHATRVLSILEAADAFEFSSNLLYALFVTLGGHPESARVRAFLLKCLKELPAGEADDALTAYCSTCSRDDALALLEKLVQCDYELADNQVVLFLVNIAPPDADVSGEPLTVPLSSGGQLSRLALLLNEADASLGSGSMAFLIQRVIELSKFEQQQQHVITGLSEWDAALAADLDAMRDLLTHALSSYSSEQVREFLSQVVPRADLWCLESVLRALE